LGQFRLQNITYQCHKVKLLIADRIHTDIISKLANQEHAHLSALPLVLGMLRHVCQLLEKQLELMGIFISSVIRRAGSSLFLWFFGNMFLFTIRGDTDVLNEEE
jgi:hypothetical protein